MGLGISWEKVLAGGYMVRFFYEFAVFTLTKGDDSIFGAFLALKLTGSCADSGTGT